MLVFDFGILAMNIWFFGELPFGISSTQKPNWPSRIARHGVAKIQKTAYEGKTILFRVFGIVTKTPLPSRIRDTFFKIELFQISLPKQPKLFVWRVLEAEPRKYQNQIFRKTTAIWVFEAPNTKTIWFFQV